MSLSEEPQHLAAPKHNSQVNRVTSVSDLPAKTASVHPAHPGTKNKLRPWDFPGHPVVTALSFRCRERKFDPWSGNRDPASRVVQPKKLKIKKQG